MGEIVAVQNGEWGRQQQLQDATSWEYSSSGGVTLAANLGDSCGGRMP